MDRPEIRNAASVIVLRDKGDDPKVLMGQRGAGAAFMPSKFVFPGGALDVEDGNIALSQPINETCETRLRKHIDQDISSALVNSAIRELWEETGLMLGEPGVISTLNGAELPSDWQAFHQAGLSPSGTGLRFVFRAVTPPGRPRRFDARFFVADASCVAGDIDDFSHAGDELAHLQWIPLSEVRQFDLPFITEVVLAEVVAGLKDPASNGRVPYFYHEGGRSYFNRL